MATENVNREGRGGGSRELHEVAGISTNDLGSSGLNERCPACRSHGMYFCLFTCAKHIPPTVNYPQPEEAQSSTQSSMQPPFELFDLCGLTTVIEFLCLLAISIIVWCFRCISWYLQRILG